MTWTAARRASWHVVECGYGMGESSAAGCSCHVPARVLAECEAKRRIVEEALRIPDEWENDYWQGIGRAAQILAAVYADHPDYREEWRP